MLSKRKQAWGVSDLCLIIYIVTGFTFLRARLGSFAIYTVFPVWFMLTWLKSWNAMVSNRWTRLVLFSFPLFILAVYFIHYLNGVPFARGLLQSKNYTYAFVGWLIFAYYRQLKMPDRMRFFLFLGLGVAVANAGWNFFVEGSYAYASRTMTGGSLERQIEAGNIDYDLVEALESGVASFGRVCSFALLIPLLVYSHKYAVKKYKPYLILAAVVFGLTVMRASYVLSVIYTCIGLYTVLLARQRAVSVKQMWLMSLVVLAVFFSVVMILANPILSVAENWAFSNDNEVYLSKIQDIKTALETGEFEALPRIYNYQASATLIGSNPLGGVGYEGRLGLGGHSQILDMLALEGLLGFLPYLIFLAITNRYFVRVVDQRWVYAKNVRSVLWIPLIFACFTNPMDSYDVWLLYFFYAPALVYTFKEPFRPPADREALPLPLPRQA